MHRGMASYHCRATLCIFTIHIFFYVSCLGCSNLHVFDNDMNATNETILARRGRTVILVCDGSCQGRGFTPALQWFQPNGDIIYPFPGRLMSVPSSGRRQQKLYIRGFGQRDVGTYTCKGWVKGRWKRISRRIYLTSNFKTETRSTLEDRRTTASTVPPSTLPRLPSPNIQR